MKYPYDIVSFVRQKTLSIEAHFVREKTESPMKVFDRTFSRFTTTIIADGETPYCNIPIESLAGMRTRTNLAAEAHFAPKTIAPQEDLGVDTSSIAFTRKFICGDLKGKSPAEVLIENPEGGKKILNEQYLWLTNNLEKYPKNAELIDAIMVASRLDLSSVKPIASAPGNTFEILDIGCRPLIRKKRESDGKCFVYECKIIWDCSRKYPVSCTIKNYYADVKQTETGTLNVNLSSKDTNAEVEKEFSMTADEWLYALGEMESARDCFKMAHFLESYNMAENAASAARAGRAS